MAKEAEVVDRKRDKLGEYLQKSITKSELAIKHAIGLGATPNVVPISKPKFKDKPRPVEVGWHPVGGLAGKWFAEETGLGKMITEKINNYPDPTQHWAVLVGEFAHQLWMDEKFHVIYVNERIKREEWRTFSVGETRFNDDAIRRTGEEVIQCIRERQPAYNLITNNCQTYALQLLDAIKAADDRDFGTTLAIYERLVGPGKVKDLFPDTNLAPDAESAPPALPSRPSQLQICAPPSQAQDNSQMVVHQPQMQQQSFMQLQQPHIMYQPQIQQQPQMYQPHVQYPDMGQQDMLAPPQHQLRPKKSSGLGRKNTVRLAQQVMNDNTTRLETGRETTIPEEGGGGARGFGFGGKADKERKKRSGMFSSIFRK